MRDEDQVKMEGHCQKDTVGRILSEGHCQKDTVRRNMKASKMREQWAIDRTKRKGLCKTCYRAQGDSAER